MAMDIPVWRVSVPDVIYPILPSLVCSNFEPDVETPILAQGRAKTIAGSVGSNRVAWMKVQPDTLPAVVLRDDQDQHTTQRTVSMYHLRRLTPHARRPG